MLLKWKRDKFLLKLMPSDLKTHVISNNGNEGSGSTGGCNVRVKCITIMAKETANGTFAIQSAAIG